MPKSRELKPNESFLVLDRTGFVFRTMSKKEANIIASWCEPEPIFYGIVSSNDFMVIGTTCSEPIKKLVTKIPLAKPYEKNLWFDVYEIQELNLGTKIKSCYIVARKELKKSLIYQN